MHQNSLPLHVACIMDGNGRWAKKRGLPRVAGHKKGTSTVKKIVKHASEVNIKYLSMFAFSIENWLRPADEISFLMALLESYIKSERDELIRNNIQLKVSGKLSMLPNTTVELINQVIKDTENNTGMVLNLVISYGSKDEITDACKQIAQDVQQNIINTDDISMDLIRSKLYNADIPDIDLLIRTSGEYRISNFMLWQAAYAELYFTDTLWPDFDEKCFDAALSDYIKRTRRFGKTDEQLTKS